MLLVHGVRRRRRSPLDDLVLPDMTALMPSDSAPYEMTNAVHALKAEDFELLVALVYQRQGYRVSMPAGLSGGRGGDFLLLRKSERLLVQCKNQRQDFRLPVERVRELQEAVETAGATRGLFVTSCGFTWDARNFAKTKGMTVINARTTRRPHHRGARGRRRGFARGRAVGAEVHDQGEADAADLPDLRGRDGADRRERRHRVGVQPAARLPWTAQRAQLSKHGLARRADQAHQILSRLARLTRSISVTKLTRPVSFTRLTRLAPPAKHGRSHRNHRRARRACKTRQVRRNRCFPGACHAGNAPRVQNRRQPPPPARPVVRGVSFPAPDRPCHAADFQFSQPLPIARPGSFAPWKQGRTQPYCPPPRWENPRRFDHLAILGPSWAGKVSRIIPRIPSTARWSPTLPKVVCPVSPSLSLEASSDKRMDLMRRCNRWKFGK